MNLIEVIELIGSVLVMAGTLSFSLSVKKGEKYTFLAFSLLGISNALMTAFFLYHGRASMIVLMMFFITTSIIGMIRTYKFSGIKLRFTTFKYLLVSSMMIYFLTLGFYSYKENIFQDNNLILSTLEIIASILAIVGSIVVSYKEYEAKVMAFSIFMIANFMFLYNGLINGYIFYSFQMVFSIFTTGYALKNLLLNSQSFKLAQERI